MNILQISTLDNGGGAAKIPRDMFENYKLRGHRSMMAVGFQSDSFRTDSDIFEIPNNRFRNRFSRCLYRVPSYLHSRRIPGSLRLQNALMFFAEPNRALKRISGLEDFDFPATSRLIELVPFYPDIVHCHNLHGDYFDLRSLIGLSQKVPLVLTLHDMWLFTGHCAYSISCDRWRIGCGQCPDLTLYPRISRDKTADNWQRKKRIFAHSHLYISTPSRWLMELAQQSILKAVEYRVIPNGVNLNIFNPNNRRQARLILDIPHDATVLLFVGSSGAMKSKFKNYAMVERAIQKIAAEMKKQNLIFINLGAKKDTVSSFGHCQVRYYAFRNSQEKVALFYQAADLFFHAAKADTFPTTILEALACGIPVIATSVGGIPEQIKDGLTGFLVSKNDADEMAKRALHLLKDRSLRQKFAHAAVDSAKKKFDLTRQINDYLSWYNEIVNCSVTSGDHEPGKQQQGT